MKKPTNKNERANSSAAKPSWMGDYSIGQVSNALQSSSKKSGSTNPTLDAMFGDASTSRPKQKKTGPENGNSGDGKHKKKKQKNMSPSTHSSNPGKGHDNLHSKQLSIDTFTKPASSQSQHIKFGDDDGDASFQRSKPASKKNVHHKKKQIKQSEHVLFGDNKPVEKKRFKVKRNRKKGKGTGNDEKASSTSASGGESVKIDSGNTSIKDDNSSPQSKSIQKRKKKKSKNKKNMGSLETKSDKILLKGLKDTSSTDNQSQEKDGKKKKRRKPKKKSGGGDQNAGGDSKENIASGKKDSDLQKTPGNDSKKKNRRKRKLKSSCEAQSSQPQDTKKVKISPQKVEQSGENGEKLTPKRKRKPRHKKKAQTSPSSSPEKKTQAVEDEKSDSGPKQTTQRKKRQDSDNKQNRAIASDESTTSGTPTKKRPTPVSAAEKEITSHQSPIKAKKMKMQTPQKAKLPDKDKQVKQKVIEKVEQESESEESESEETDSDDSSSSDEKSKSFKKMLLSKQSREQPKQKKKQSDSDDDSDESPDDSDESPDDSDGSPDNMKDQAIRKAIAASKNLKQMRQERQKSSDDESDGAGPLSQLIKCVDKEEKITKHKKKNRKANMETDSDDESDDESESDDDDDDDDAVKGNDGMAGKIDEILNEHDEIELKTTNGASRRKTDDVDSDSDQKESSTPIKSKNDPEVLQRTIFVGNVPTGVARGDVRALFKKYGAIDTIRFRSGARADPKLTQKVAMITKDLHPERSSFNAYVLFKKAESAQKALAGNGELLGNHHIRVDLAKDSKKHDNKLSVFVGNLPFDIETEPLTRHFMQCGNVQNTRLIRDPKTGLGKGFGYILFEDSSCVELALKLDRSLLSGRNIRVSRALSKEKLKNILQKKTRTSQKGGQSKGGTSKGKGGQEKRRWMDPKILKKRMKRKRYRSKLKAKGKL